GIVDVDEESRGRVIKRVQVIADIQIHRHSSANTPDAVLSCLVSSATGSWDLSAATTERNPFPQSIGRAPLKRRWSRIGAQVCRIVRRRSDPPTTFRSQTMAPVSSQK